MSSIIIDITREDSSSVDAELLLGIRGQTGLSAYEYAVMQGYSGTESDFSVLMASYATVAESAAESASESAQSAVESAQSADASEGYASDAERHMNSALDAAAEARTSATSASQSAGVASSKADEAGESATSASNSADAAAGSASSASTSASSASTSESNASASATSASASAQSALVSEQNASASATRAESARDEILALDIVEDVTLDGDSIVDANGVARLPIVDSTHAGAMSATDKVKLDGIADGAEKNYVTAISRGTSTPDQAQTNNTDYILTYRAQGDITDNIHVPNCNVATTSKRGLMSPSDKTKLDGIESGAKVNVQGDWTQSDSTADDYIKNKPTLPTKVSEFENDVPYIGLDALELILPKDTASGDIISIPDGQSIIPVESLKVTLEPIQDLHGYDKPWSAGAGKNVLPFYTNGADNLGLTVSYDESEECYIINGTATSSGNLQISNPSKVAWITGETYTFSVTKVGGSMTIGEGTGITFAIALFNSNYSGWIRGSTTETDINSNLNATYTAFDATNGHLLLQCWRVGTVFNNLKIRIQIEKGSTATSWTPYENIAPISGWTDVDTHRTGVNVWDEEWEVGSISATTGENVTTTDRIRSKNYTKVVEATYYLKNGSNVGSAFVFCYDDEKNFLGLATRVNNAETSNVSNRQFVLRPNTAFIRFYMSNTYGTTYNNDICINYPSTDTEYHPYDGKTIHTEIKGHYTVTSTDNTPYLLKEVSGIDGDRLREKIIGGTVAWNQLVPTASRDYINTGTESYSSIMFFFRLNASPYTQFYSTSRSTAGLFAFVKKATATGKAEMIHNGSRTQMKFANNVDVVENHYYLGMINFTSLDASTVGGVVAKDVQLFDLTQMFGSTIADYIYSLEQANAGAGVAWFKSLFPNDYYPYDAGSLKSVQTSAHVTKDADDNVLGNYPLASDLELRGMPKLTDGNLYYDGDTYEADGTVTRKYGIVDLGTLNWSYQASTNRFIANIRTLKNGIASSAKANIICTKYPTVSNLNTQTAEADKVIGASPFSDVVVRDTSFNGGATAFKTAMNGVQLVYELATPTTEQAEPFTEVQKVINGGTEEYIDTRDVPIPVGHETEYLSRVTYGCTIDLVSGECVIDRAIAVLDGTTARRRFYGTWGATNNGYGVYWNNDVPRDNGAISDKFVVSTRGYDSMPLGSFVGGSGVNTTWTFILPSSVTSLAEANAWLAENPTTIAYHLATPIKIQLTPQEIRLLVGDNNLWSDGQVTMVYSADVARWVEKKLNS